MLRVGAHSVNLLIVCTGVSEIRPAGRSSRLEFFRHGGAQKGEQEGVRHDQQEDESASRINDVAKRKTSAASSASRRATKTKTARSAKAKPDKAEAKRRAARALRARPPSVARVRRRRPRPQSLTPPRPARPPQPNPLSMRPPSPPWSNPPSPSPRSKPSRPAQPLRRRVRPPSRRPSPPRRSPSARRSSQGRPVDVAASIETESVAVRSARPASGPRQGFKVSEFVVYPAHGVGQIVAVEDQEVAGFRLELFVINFAKDKMTLRVPTSKVAGVGMRKLSDPDVAKRSLEILTGRARIKRTMWSRRAQEYEAKINSGDINAIAEVVRDLYRSEAQPEQSYSERQLYEAALDRIMREIAAVQKLSRDRRAEADREPSQALAAARRQDGRR